MISHQCDGDACAGERDGSRLLPAPHSAVLSFSATKDGKVNVNYQGWDAGKVVLEGDVFEARGGGGSHCSGG
jgi:hypothetical protein